MHRAFLNGPMVGFFAPLIGILFLLTPLEPNSVHGKVVDEQGHAMPRAVVHLRLHGGSTELRAECEANGTFRFDRLPAGSYALYSEAPHYYQKPSPEIVYDSIGEFGPEITLPSANDAAISLVMNPMATLKGRVFLPDGRPLRSGSVTFTAPRPEMFTARFPVKTNREGAFELEFRYAGDENFEAILPHVGYVPGTCFSLTAGKSVKQDFAIQTPGAITGQVRSKTDGRPMRKAYVTAELKDPGIEYNGRRWIRYFRLLNMNPRLDDQGEFSIDNLPPGDYILKASPTEAQYFQDPPIRTTFKITLTQGERRRGIVFRL